jgi:hypothetical protein
MRFALPTVVALTLLGCSGERAQPSPTAPGPPVPITPLPPATPLPPPPQLTFVWVVVIPAGSGVCIPGATVEIVLGQGLGRSVTQTTRGCSYWDPDYDAIFDGLNAGEELTLRASASGYAAKEIAVVAPERPRTVPRRSHRLAPSIASARPVRSNPDSSRSP